MNSPHHILVVPKIGKEAVLQPDRYGASPPIATLFPRGWEIGRHSGGDPTKAIILAWGGRIVKSGIAWTQLHQVVERDLTPAVRRMLVKPSESAESYLIHNCEAFGRVVFVDAVGSI